MQSGHIAPGSLNAFTKGAKTSASLGNKVVGSAQEPPPSPRLAKILTLLKPSIIGKHLTSFFADEDFVFGVEVRSKTLVITAYFISCPEGQASPSEAIQVKSGNVLNKLLEDAGFSDAEHRSDLSIYPEDHPNISHPFQTEHSHNYFIPQEAGKRVLWNDQEQKDCREKFVQAAQRCGFEDVSGPVNDEIARIARIFPNRRGFIFEQSHLWKAIPDSQKKEVEEKFRAAFS